jgi:hypothetical protein
MALNFLLAHLKITAKRHHFIWGTSRAEGRSKCLLAKNELLFFHLNENFEKSGTNAATLNGSSVCISRVNRYE